MHGQATHVTRFLAFVTLLMVTPMSIGCVGFLSHLGYWSGATIVDPEYADLEGQRVAVICVSDTASYGAGTESTRLARLISNLLDENVPDIKLVPASEVEDWIDKNDWDTIDYREAGSGVRADLVVAVDVSNYRLREDQVLYKGRAKVTVTVFDMNDEGREVFRRNLAEITYPATGYYHTSDASEATFQQIFLRVLAGRVAKHFFAYDKLSESDLDPAVP